MGRTQQNFAVMFADVAGSTGLYDRLGDSIASQMIGDAIQLVCELIRQNQGVVVKTIGDEVMCRFPDADSAISCACQIHETMDNQPIRNGVGLMFSIGVHWGTAILEDDGDIFGDVVNLASKVAKLAKARQIITTDTTQRSLTQPELIEKCREMDRMHIKGRSEPVTLYEVMWEPEDTQVMPTIISHSLDLISDKPLTLRYQQYKHVLRPGMPAYTFGRGTQCDQLVASTCASRQHARIENRQGVFFLVDESTNGTYIKVGDKTAFFLRHQEVPLQGEGVISFGQEVEQNHEHLLHFSF